MLLPRGDFCQVAAVRQRTQSGIPGYKFAAQQAPAVVAVVHLWMGKISHDWHLALISKGFVAIYSGVYGWRKPVPDRHTAQELHKPALGVQGPDLLNALRHVPCGAYAGLQADRLLVPALCGLAW